MAFGKAFKTRKEANKHLKKMDNVWGSIKIRRLSKKAFPRRKKIFHVGTEIDYLNFE